MTEPQDPKVLLFDLGGVLVRVDWSDDLLDMASGPLTAEEAESRYNAFQPYLDYEEGLLTSAEYGEAIHSYFALKVSPAEFLQRFAAWPKGLYPGARELLSKLQPRFRLAALSNSNELHWPGFDDFLPLFERAFASHEVKLRKPDPAFYLHAARELAVAPQEVCFFDDRIVNVEAARAVGMQAHQVNGIDEVRDCLVRLGYLDG